MFTCAIGLIEMCPLNIYYASVPAITGLRVSTSFCSSFQDRCYTVTVCLPSGPKKLHTSFIAITLLSINFHDFLAHILCRKFATGWCIVSPPNTVCVTALPCKILNHNVHFYSLLQKRYPLTFAIIANYFSNFHKRTF